MKKVLIVGSAVVDVIIHLEHLPKTQEDVHVLRQNMSLGGCAYNTSDMIRHFKVPYILFSPVGTGAYGDFVRAQLALRGVTSPIPTPDCDNGCCYCFVEEGGERTFASYHGAEYRFEREWFSLIDPDEIDSVYICGLEIEEPTGENIVSWLEEHPQLQIYFAPGPRINRIAPALLERLFALHPILHLNEEEALSYAKNNASLKTDTSYISKMPGSTDGPLRSYPLEQAAGYLFSCTGNTVIITRGPDGALCLEGQRPAGYIPGISARQIDTIGAGDSHIGAVIACRKLGMTCQDAIATANLVAARVVETEGALLSDDAFAQIRFSR